jgi:serine/threonine-protein kinase
VQVLDGPHAGTVVTWDQPGPYLIGRAPHARLALLHDLVASLEHCRLEVNERGCVIQDLGSRQGTLVNGSAVSRSFLQSGDVIKVGLSRLSVTISVAVDSEKTVLRRQSWSPTAATVIGDETDDAARLGGGMLDIPGYSIVREIGKGGMGVVYEAQRKSTAERVAIKTIVPAPGAAHRQVQLFLREVEVQSQLTHPRIVRFIESGEHAGQVFLVMEFVETVEVEPLLKTLARAKQVQVYCGIVCQVLEALDFAHQRKLVHRDVKPRNILVTKSGSKLSAKLADFGLAKNFELAGLSQLTADNEIRGTPAFMPWEQLRSSRYVKPAADIYAAGATLYFYLVGQTPGHTTQGAPDTARPPDVPQGLWEVIDRALDADPKRRFATAGEMRGAVLPFARAQDGLAVRPH